MRECRGGPGSQRSVRLCLEHGLSLSDISVWSCHLVLSCYTYLLPIIGQCDVRQWLIIYRLAKDLCSTTLRIPSTSFTKKIGVQLRTFLRATVSHKCVAGSSWLYINPVNVSPENPSNMQKLSRALVVHLQDIQSQD